MSLDLWRPLKITNPLLENIFKLPIDGKLLSTGKAQAHPLIIFENKNIINYLKTRIKWSKIYLIYFPICLFYY